MDHLVMCTKAKARACWTLPDILKVTDDPDFQAYADENYFLADEEDNNDGLDDDGYFTPVTPASFIHWRHTTATTVLSQRYSSYTTKLMNLVLGT
jgi:hypothetical protein